jgi:hypothetical protein
MAQRLTMDTKRVPTSSSWRGEFGSLVRLPCSAAAFSGSIGDSDLIFKGETCYASCNPEKACPIYKRYPGSLRASPSLLRASTSPTEWNLGFITFAMPSIQRFDHAI